MKNSLNNEISRLVQYLPAQRNRRAAAARETLLVNGQPHGWLNDLSVKALVVIIVRASR